MWKGVWLKKAIYINLTGNTRINYGRPAQGGPRRALRCKLPGGAPFTRFTAWKPVAMELLALGSFQIIGFIPPINCRETPQTFSCTDSSFVPEVNYHSE
jgi:hypothetical protein